MKVYNFFKFLEDKEGKEIPYKVAFAYKQEQKKKAIAKNQEIIIKKVKENPNYKLTQEDVDNFENQTGYVSLHGVQIKSLSDNLTINNTLSISNNSLIKELPKGLKIGDSLYAYNTNISSLPKDLIVKRRMDITNTPLINNLELEYPDSRQKIKQELKQMAPGVGYFYWVSKDEEDYDYYQYL
jgi:hypothetical protein